MSCNRIAMYLDKIKHINIEIKIINLDIDRIATKLEENNRSIKDILKNGDITSRAQELKEMVEFNRFLLQKQKEKTIDKRNLGLSLKSCLHEENKVESELIEDEKRLEYLILTLDKNLEFNAAHPFYNDLSFIRDLLKEFLKKEDYEICAQLKNQLEILSQPVL